MVLKVTFRPQAEQDLTALYEHIANDSPDRAIGFVRRLRSRCEALAEFSERGRLREDLAPGLRILVFERSAVIAYRVDAEQVRIIDIFYRGRDYEAILRDESGTDDTP